MPKAHNFIVWTWTDFQDVPRYVGWGSRDPNHPAKRMWAQRYGVDSDVHYWLRKHEREPKRIDHAEVVRYYRDEAASVAAAIRAKYKAEGHKLLDSRPWGTKEGGGAPRMVMSPDLSIYPSVRQAAISEGVSPCTITRWCQSKSTDWDYVN